ncbi:hypothetical protein [Herbidospora sp. NBRC 101105]|nr:hypothetical protein [Herbidospora sp. NBRC 101105]
MSTLIRAMLGSGATAQRVPLNRRVRRDAVAHRTFDAHPLD